MITCDKLNEIYDAYNDFRINEWDDVIKVKKFLSLDENKDMSVHQAFIALGIEKEGDAPWYVMVKEIIDTGKYDLNDESCVEGIVNDIIEYCKKFKYNTPMPTKEIVKDFIETILLFKYV